MRAKIHWLNKHKRARRMLSRTRRRRREESGSESDESISEDDNTNMNMAPFLISQSSPTDILINGEIDATLSFRFTLLLKKMETRLQIQKAMDQFYQPIITITLTSCGGCTASAFAMTDAIINCKIPVRTLLRGQVASAGTFIAVSATDTCIVSSSCTILIHELSSGMIGKFSELKEETENCTHLMDAIKDFYLKQCPRLKRKALDRLIKKEKLLDATQAVNMGFCDAIEGATRAE
jgi:ATP-dependent protease ClpP protease subunit